MNTYGDDGNILAIKRRCEWRNIRVNIDSVTVNQKLKSNYFDLFFFGGGQDKNQIIVSKDLHVKKNILVEYLEREAVLLSICGGYQLLQDYFKTSSGKVIQGINVFKAHTIASDKRMTQNLKIKINQELFTKIASVYQNNQSITPYLIGFENHSGQTFLKNKSNSIGKVVSGSGNNGKDNTSGAIYKNALGCYLHGSLLPKNPHFADYLIYEALNRKYKRVSLSKLDDTIEWQAHNDALKIS